MNNLENQRQEYKKLKLEESNVLADPISQFHLWFQELAQLNSEIEVNAMTVSTIGTDDIPRNRVVLLKSYNQEGFIFYTNYKSNKGNALDNNSNICASFYWWPLERQVIIKGKASKIDEKESEAYFNSRPKGSQIGAIVSSQSQIINGRTEIEKRYNQLMEEYKDTNPKKPVDWGGYLIKPIEIEFWQGRESRLHDRINYTLQYSDWKIERLSP